MRRHRSSFCHHCASVAGRSLQTTASGAWLTGSRGVTQPGVQVPVVRVNTFRDVANGIPDLAAHGHTAAALETDPSASLVLQHLAHFSRERDERALERKEPAGARRVSVSTFTASERGHQRFKPPRTHHAVCIEKDEHFAFSEARGIVHRAVLAAVLALLDDGNAGIVPPEHTGCLERPVRAAGRDDDLEVRVVDLAETCQTSLQRSPFLPRRDNNRDARPGLRLGLALPADQRPGSETATVRARRSGAATTAAKSVATRALTVAHRRPSKRGHAGKASHRGRRRGTRGRRAPVLAVPPAPSPGPATDLPRAS